MAHLGTPVVSFCAFHVRVSLLKLSIREKGTLIVVGFLGNLLILPGSRRVPASRTQEGSWFKSGLQIPHPNPQDLTEPIEEL